MLTTFMGRNGFSFYEQTTSRPTLEITSVSGGFQGEGIKPIIPNRARAKIACRLVAAQVPEEIMDSVETSYPCPSPSWRKSYPRPPVARQPFYHTN